MLSKQTWDHLDVPTRDRGIDGGLKEQNKRALGGVKESWFGCKNMTVI